MGKLELTTLNVDDRVDDAIRESMVIYCNKLANNNISVGLEATFQHELALILRDVLNLKTLTSSERFSLTLEQNIPVGGKKNYVDIVIHYDENGKDRADYLIELKFKKESDSVPDLGTLETYFDFYNLDRLCNTSLNPGNIKNLQEYLFDGDSYYIYDNNAVGKVNDYREYYGLEKTAKTTIDVKKNPTQWYENLCKSLDELKAKSQGLSRTEIDHILWGYEKFKVDLVRI